MIFDVYNSNNCIIRNILYVKHFCTTQCTLLTLRMRMFKPSYTPPYQHCGVFCPFVDVILVAIMFNRGRGLLRLTQQLTTSIRNQPTRNYPGSKIPRIISYVIVKHTMYFVFHLFGFLSMYLCSYCLILVILMILFIKYAKK